MSFENLPVYSRPISQPNGFEPHPVASRPGRFHGRATCGRIAIAYGRDVADVALFTQFGDPLQILGMTVTVERLAAPPLESYRVHVRNRSAHASRAP
ncbi:hypothetical protein Pan189_12300 [Stratiformator vulcanicus]|uniref:Uncharacterized protein n=1 Tax=Stratiformator vulcanicus TaxID=2527980 RepID=A0A517QYY7_9PLAN|nr:hypothetical protein Pan189_12300 [Stratiformator vulcanicus]